MSNPNLSKQNQAQNLYFLPSGTWEEFNTVIEIPQGSSNKYEIDPETGAVLLDRVLYSADFYPFNYGFIPSTKTEDGDALDVAVIMTNPVPPGCVVKCRAIGVMEMFDDGEKDYNVIAVPVDDPRFNDTKDISDLAGHTLKEFEDFFKTYKRLQGKKTDVRGTLGADKVQAEIEPYLNNYPYYGAEVDLG